MAAAVLFVVLAAGVYAYLSFLPPPAGPRASILSYPLEFSVELDKAEYLVGENATIRLCLKNIGNQTITLTFPSMWTEYDYDKRRSYSMHFDFTITDANGAEVYQWSKGRLAIPATYDVTLNPEEEINNTILWYYPKYVSVPAGIYSLRGMLYRIEVAGIWPITLETPQITFTIK